MKSERLCRIKDLCIIIISALLIGYIGAKFFLPVILPFLIAYGIAAMTRSPADFLARKCKISRKFVRPALAVLIMLITVGGFILAAVYLAAELWELLGGLTADGTLSEIIDKLRIPFGNILGKLEIAPELESGIEEAVREMLSGVLSSAAGVVTDVAAAVPKIILFLLVSVISTVYFAIDLEKFSAKAAELLPKAWMGYLRSFRESSASAAVKYLRSYLILMLLTFSLMLLGLTLLRVEYALLLAFVISLLDILPIIGIGIILIPYGAFSLLTGNVRLGVGLLVLYAAASVIKQIAEPRIVGKNLGIHPLLTLALMYIGYSLFGIAGLILLPMTAVLFSGLPKKSIPPRSDSESAAGSSDTHL